MGLILAISSKPRAAGSHHGREKRTTLPLGERDQPINLQRSRCQFSCRTHLPTQRKRRKTLSVLCPLTRIAADRGRAPGCEPPSFVGRRPDRPGRPRNDASRRNFELPRALKAAPLELPRVRASGRIGARCDFGFEPQPFAHEIEMVFLNAIPHGAVSQHPSAARRVVRCFNALPFRRLHNQARSVEDLLAVPL